MSTPNATVFNSLDMAEADAEMERQAYLDEAHIESSQFGVGRWIDDEEVRD